MERADLVSHSAAATERAAGAVGRALEPGDIVLISGDVGTGKTTFVRGACRGLGVTAAVTSPSFTIGHVYAGRLPVAHVDLFRLESLGGEDPALLDDYITPERVSFVEWPGVARGLGQDARVVLDLRLSHLGGDSRGIEARGRGPLLTAIRDALAAPARR